MLILIVSVLKNQFQVIIIILVLLLKHVAVETRYTVWTGTCVLFDCVNINVSQTRAAILTR